MPFFLMQTPGLEGLGTNEAMSFLRIVAIVRSLITFILKLAEIFFL